MPGRRSEPRLTTASAERLGYAVAVAILIVGGALVRTPILNWICGPAIVVACAVGVPTLLGHRSPAKARRPGPGST